MKITLCIDKQDRNNPSSELKQYSIDIGCPLRSYGEFFDELKISTNDTNSLVGVIIRRCYVDKYGVLKKLEAEEIQELEIPKIMLFEGANYVYIKEFTNLNMKIEYLTNAEMNKYFATKAEMNSSIKQTYDSIMLSVAEKADSKEVSAMIKLLFDEIALKVAKGDVVNEFNISDELISIIGNRLKIDTDNFKLTEVGNMTCNNAVVNGGMINLSGTEEIPAFNVISDDEFERTIITPTGYQSSYFPDGGSNSTMTSLIQTNENYSTFLARAGGFETKISSYGNEFLPCATLYQTIYDSNTVYNNFRLYSDYSNLSMRRNDKSIELRVEDNDMFICAEDGNNSTYIYPNVIYTPSLVQTSKEEVKKNFEKLENAIDIIKNTDIYKYNLKSQADDDKKHIGFVIGKNYKYSNEITSLDKDKNEIGVDIYSMVSVCFKAIQEQQEQIENLENKIKELEGDK